MMIISAHTAEIAGDQAQHHADNRGNQRGHHAHQQRNPHGKQQSAEYIPSYLIRSQPELQVGRAAEASHNGIRIIRGDHRSQ